MPRIRVFHLLQQAHSALFRASDKSLRDLVGLTASQQAVLYCLVQEDGVPISNIANRLNMGLSSLTGLIDRMAEKGFVRRQQSEKDARIYEIYLEQAGRDIADATLARTKKINGELLEPFSNEERAVIKRFLDHVSSNSMDIVNKHSVITDRERELKAQSKQLTKRIRS